MLMLHSAQNALYLKTLQLAIDMLHGWIRMSHVCISRSFLMVHHCCQLTLLAILHHFVFMKIQLKTEEPLHSNIYLLVSETAVSIYLPAF